MHDPHSDTSPAATDAREFHLLASGGETAVELLAAAASDLSKQQLKRIMQSGAVWLAEFRGDGKKASKPRRLRRASRLLKSGDELHCYYRKEFVEGEVPAAELISDEADYSVWLKPCGMFCQGSKWGDRGTIVRWVEQYFDNQRPVFSVHRLDRATRGLILVAHSKRATRELTALFEQRKIQKKYRALVHGDHRSHPQPETVRAEIDGRSACSHFNCLEYDAASDRSLMDVDIETGRKHQIRRHLASIGLPIVGDRLYGRGGDEEDLQLTAWSLSYCCPLSGEHKQYRLSES